MANNTQRITNLEGFASEQADSIQRLQTQLNDSFSGLKLDFEEILNQKMEQMMKGIEALLAVREPQPKDIPDQFCATMAAVIQEDMQQARDTPTKPTDNRLKSHAHPKSDRRVLICGYTEEDDYVVTKIVESKYDLDDEVVDCEEKEFHQTQLQIQQIDSVVVDDGDLEFKEELLAKVEDPISLVNDVCAESIQDKVKYLFETDFSYLSLANNTVIGVFEKKFHVASNVFDENPEQKGYIISIDPDPPDDYDSDTKGMVIDESHFRLHVNSLQITFISSVEIMKHVDDKNGTILNKACCSNLNGSSSTAFTETDEVKGMAMCLRMSLPIDDFSSPKVVASTVERVLCANKKLICFEGKVLDETPERDGYIPTLNPEPPDDYDQFNGHVLTISFQMYGYQVIQKAIEVVNLDQQPKMVVELDGRVTHCVVDQNENHVTPQCIKCIPEYVIPFIVSSIYDQVVTMST